MQRFMSFRIRILAALAACVATVAFSVGAQASPLAAGDKIRIDVFGRSDLSGEFEVRASGRLMLPLLGEIAAAGLTIEALEVSVARELAKKVERSPVVTISNVALRPVYVLGYVRAASAVPFRQGMTALQAIASAGGYGAGRSTSAEAQIEAIKAREARETLLVRRDSLLVRSARLQAERDNKQRLALDSLTDERMKLPAVAALVDTEKSLLASRIAQLEAQTESQVRRAGIYREEIAALETQLKSLQEERTIVVTERNITTGLAKQNLASRPRAAESEKSVLRVNSEIAAVTAYLARARASLAQAEQEQRDILANRQQQVLAEFNTTADALRDVQERLASAREQVAVTSTGLGTPAVRESFTKPGALVLIRNGQRSPIDETTVVLAGDTIDVPFPDDR